MPLAPLALAPPTPAALPCPSPFRPPVQLPVPLLSAAAMESVRSLRWSPSPSSGGLREAAYGLERQLSKKLPRHKNRGMALSAILLLCFAVRRGSCNLPAGARLPSCCRVAGWCSPGDWLSDACAAAPGVLHGCRRRRSSGAGFKLHAHAPFVSPAPACSLEPSSSNTTPQWLSMARDE